MSRGCDSEADASGRKIDRPTGPALFADTARVVKVTIRAAAIGLVLLAGCGQSDREKAQDVAEEFATDLREKRGDPCELLSNELVGELGGKRCDARVRRYYAAKVGNGKVTVHRVYEDSSYTRAEATVGDVQLMLNDSLDTWHIDTLNP